MGLVPNMSDVVELGDYSKRVDNDQGLYSTDFAMRMKNKSNAGRSFVFHQLGIPVISDITPSNLHILGDPDCGYVAFNKNSWKKAIEALEHVKDAGMDPYLNITVGHYNAFNEDFKALLDYSKNKKYRTLINVAVPAGMWQKMDEIICDDKDRQHLKNLRKEYKNLVRNIWNPFDKTNEKILGCTTVNRLYITPLGDVLVCPYVHIKIGNILKQNLKDIVEKGFSIKYFRNHSDLCLAGEDKNFINNFMTKQGQSIFNPANADEIFSSSDKI